MKKEEKYEDPPVLIGKFYGQTKKLFALTFAEVILGSLILQRLLPGYAYVYIVYAATSLLLSKINIRIIRIRDDVIYVNLAGMVLPVALALYFLPLILERINPLVVLAAYAITFLIANKFKIQSDRGQEARSLFAVAPPVLIALFATFNLLAGDSLLVIKMIFAFLIATLAAASSDIYGIKIEQERPEDVVHLMGANGIIDGVWLAGFGASVGALVLS